MRIELNYNELSMSLRTLLKLRKGTGYKLHPTRKFVKYSRGKMCNSVNQLYKELMIVEDEFIKMVDKTADALSNAGIDFAKAENISINIFDNLK